LAKLTLTDLSIFNPSAILAINANNALIETAMENTLSRDGTTPNMMEADLDMNSNAILNMTDLDMNSNKIFNLPEPVLPTEPVRLIDLQEAIVAGGGLTGPIGSTDNALVRWDGITGSIVQNSGVIVDDSNNITGAKSLLLTTSGNSYGLAISQAVTGTADPGVFYRNIINILDDADHSGEADGSNGFYVQHQVSGGLGGRAAGFFNMTIIDSPSALSATNDFTGLVAISSTAVGLGGTIGTPFGELFGANIAVATTAAVDYIAGAKALELDTNIAVGSTVSAKVGLHIAQVLSDKVAGSVLDAGIRFANQAGAVGWVNGIVFDNIVASPMQTTGTIFKTIGVWEVAEGIDFSSITITGNFLSGPNDNFTVTGSGVVDAVGYEINTVQFANHNGDFTQVYSQGGTVALRLGNASSPFNFIDNGSTVFRNAATTTTYVTINAAGLAIHGSTSGSLTLKVPAVAGSNNLTFPAGTTDFSATGGSGHFVKQNSAGGAFTTAAVTAAEVVNTPAGNIAAVTVQAAIDELDSEKLASASYTAADVLAKLLTVDGAGSGLDADLLDGQSSAFYATATSVSDHLADTSDAHDASAISVLDSGANYTATDVEAALAEVMDALQAHEADTSAAHAASAISFSATGNIASTDVQAAIAELDNEKQPLDADLTTLSTAFTTASATGAASLAFHEDTDNGTNRVLLQGPASTADVTVTLPAATTTLIGTDTTDTLTNKTFDANGTGNVLSNVEVADFAASAITTAADTIVGNDSDTQVPTSAAVIDYAQPLDADLTAIAALTTTAAGRSILTIADPNADRVIAWDDSAGAMAAIALADITAEAAPASGDYFLLYGAEGDLRKVNFDDMPAGGASAIDDLTDVTITALGDGELLVSSGGVWINQTFAELNILTTTAAAAAYQPLDADLTTLSTAFTTASASGAASLAFHEDTDNGSNRVLLQGPASTADVTLTLPAATDTLVGKATTDVFTNKTFDANGSGNSLSNVEVADFAATAITTAADTIVGNDSDSQVPTSAAVIDYAQPLDATLTALAAYNTNGLLTQTAADTFTGRTITGTANQISVADGNGVAGNPTLSLPADVIIPTVITVPNTGLHILDTNASHDLIIVPGSNLTADHTLTLTTGDADRTLDISAASVTISSFAASFLDDANEATFKATVNLEIGVDVQAFDADLTTLSTVFTSASASGAASLAFHEDTDNGTNRVLLQGPASTADVTLTLPAATDTLVGKATTDIFTNKTFDANGSGNSLSNVEIADFAASAITTAADTIVGNDSDSQVPTSAAVIDYAQPLDADLTAIAALTTTAAGRSVLTIADPNIDRILAWDDSAGAISAIALADINTEATPANGDFVLMYDAAGNLLKTDWANLPGASSGIPTEASSTDNAIVRWDGTGGNAVQDSAVTISDIGEITSTSPTGTGSNALIIRASTDVSDYAYIDYRFVLYNPDAGTPAKTLYSFGAEGTYTDAGSLTSYDFYIFDNAAGLYRMAIYDTGFVKIGAGAGQAPRLFYPQIESGATNTVTYPVRISSSSTGTPATGIGTGIEFEVETAAGTPGNLEVGAVIEAVSTDVTSTSEDFDLVFKTMSAGAAAAERLRIASTGHLTSSTGQTAHFWVYWTANSTTILASHNVDSIADTSIGDADITITTDFSSANWAGFVTVSDATGAWDATFTAGAGINSKAAGTLGVLCGVMQDGGTAAAAFMDPEQWQVVGFGVSA
jgi:hypothetical protein